MVGDRVEETLDLYFQQCSILVTARDLAMMAATLANGGVNPVTGERALDQRYVQDVISVMLTLRHVRLLRRVGVPRRHPCEERRGRRHHGRRARAGWASAPSRRCSTRRATAPAASACARTCLATSACTCSMRPLRKRSSSAGWMPPIRETTGSAARLPAALPAGTRIHCRIDPRVIDLEAQNDVARSPRHAGESRADHPVTADGWERPMTYRRSFPIPPFPSARCRASPRRSGAPMSRRGRSAATRSSPSSAKARWPRSTARTTRASTGRWS